MKTCTRILFAFCLLIFRAFSSSFASDGKDIGVPHIKNFTKEIYRSGNQNWSVAKDRNGIMYYGNNNGLLIYDGNSWKLYQLPNKLIVRGVATDDNGKVYTGGFGELGYWMYNEKGLFTYTSLLKLVPGGLMNKDEVWKIYVDGSRVLFQSFARIYIYENNKITTVSVNDGLLFLFKANNHFFVHVSSKGLFELKNNTLEFIDGSQFLGTSGILAILPFKNNSLLIGTPKDGLFVYDGKQFTSWKNAANEQLKKNTLNNGLHLQNGNYVFGTILNGIFVLNEYGEIVQHINKEKGLQDNTVLSLYEDENAGLWLGLDNGIDLIELNSPLSYYFDKSGIFGTIYGSVVYKNNIYLATNHGLFTSYWSNNGTAQQLIFKLIDNSQGQIWQLALIDDQLLCCHNEKTYRVEGSTLIKISDYGGGWVIKKLNQHPDYLIQGTYVGLLLYKKDKNGHWIFSHKVEGFNEPSRYVEEDSRGQLWIGHNYNGLYKLTLTDDLTKVASIKSYSEKNGLPHSLQTEVFKLDNQLVFCSEDGVHTYDALGDRFVKYDELNKRLGSFFTVNNIVKADDQHYWFIDHGKIAFVNVSQPGKIEIDSNSFNVLQGRMVDKYENINKIGNDLYLISIDGGFAIYNTGISRNDTLNLQPVLIRSVNDITDKVSLLAENNNATSSITIPYDRDNISIQYVLPRYQQSNIEYRYFLEGYSKQWSEWTTRTTKEFTNLPHGKFRFLVKARISNGKQETMPSAYEFVILPPWYASATAWVVYFLLFILTIPLVARIYKKHWEKQKEKILERLEKEKSEFLSKETLLNEQRINQIKTQQLEADLANKNRELANSTMNIVSKNELLQKINDEIVELKDKDGKKLSSSQLKKIQNVINDGMNDERDWNLFESSFNETHENFFKKLKEKHPELSPNDLKLCGYLRMNMSSKELVSIFNITIRAVEIKRYRLRKKLSLEHEKNLVEYLLEI
ncbi:ligand-binding sensor domain-containing protein [Pinibacter soli]|uniref:Triple tyrosine motif-containing protein n=1 Tax=Pinibacter soli TaxID=3044211 RepID=A0ABT6R7I4_9BACT|nr:triple tyrosine motif-containing protein [Pinibacter soli]MDI3318522.1 triple tyrosine motif-containing protein [Pinibacter soli]